MTWQNANIRHLLPKINQCIWVYCKPISIRYNMYIGNGLIYC